MSIVVGSLPSREGRAALQVAVDECLARGVDLAVVDVPGGPEGVGADELATWQDALEAAGRRLSEGGRTLTNRDAATKDIAQAIVEVAEDTHADLIVIGLRRRTPVGKLLLGSNAQRVLLEAGCPVLAVKAPEGE